MGFRRLRAGCSSSPAASEDKENLWAVLHAGASKGADASPSARSEDKENLWAVLHADLGKGAETSPSAHSEDKENLWPVLHAGAGKGADASPSARSEGSAPSASVAISSTSSDSATPVGLTRAEGCAPAAWLRCRPQPGSCLHAWNGNEAFQR